MRTSPGAAPQGGPVAVCPSGAQSPHLLWGSGVGQLSCLGAWPSAGHWARRTAPPPPHGPQPSKLSRLQLQVVYLTAASSRTHRAPRTRVCSYRSRKNLLCLQPGPRRGTCFSVAGGLPSAPGAAPAFGSKGDFWGQERRWAGTGRVRGGGSRVLSGHSDSSGGREGPGIAGQSQGSWPSSGCRDGARRSVPSRLLPKLHRTRDEEAMAEGPESSEVGHRQAQVHWAGAGCPGGLLHPPAFTGAAQAIREGTRSAWETGGPDEGDGGRGWPAQARGRAAHTWPAGALLAACGGRRAEPGGPGTEGGTAGAGGLPRRPVTCLRAAAAGPRLLRGCPRTHQPSPPDGTRHWA